MDATAKHSSWILRLLPLLQYYSSQVCIHASTLSVFFARKRGTFLVCIHDAPVLRLKNEKSLASCVPRSLMTLLLPDGWISSESHDREQPA